MDSLVSHQIASLHEHFFTERTFQPNVGVDQQVLFVAISSRETFLAELARVGDVLVDDGVAREAALRVKLLIAHFTAKNLFVGMREQPMDPPVLFALETQITKRKLALEGGKSFLAA